MSPSPFKPLKTIDEAIFLLGKGSRESDDIKRSIDVVREIKARIDEPIQQVGISILRSLARGVFGRDAELRELKQGAKIDEALEKFAGFAQAGDEKSSQYRDLLSRFLDGLGLFNQEGDLDWDPLCSEGDPKPRIIQNAPPIPEKSPEQKHDDQQYPIKAEQNNKIDLDSSEDKLNSTEDKLNSTEDKQDSSEEVQDSSDMNLDSLLSDAEKILSPDQDNTSDEPPSPAILPPSPPTSLEEKDIDIPDIPDSMIDGEEEIDKTENPTHIPDPPIQKSVGEKIVQNIDMMMDEFMDESSVYFKDEQSDEAIKKETLTKNKIKENTDQVKKEKQKDPLIFESKLINLEMEGTEKEGLFSSSDIKIWPSILPPPLANESGENYGKWLEGEAYHKLAMVMSPGLEQDESAANDFIEILSEFHSLPEGAVKTYKTRQPMIMDDCLKWADRLLLIGQDLGFRGHDAHKSIELVMNSCKNYFAKREPENWEFLKRTGFQLSCDVNLCAVIGAGLDIEDFFLETGPENASQGRDIDVQGSLSPSCRIDSPHVLDRAIFLHFTSSMPLSNGLMNALAEFRHVQLSRYLGRDVSSADFDRWLANDWLMPLDDFASPAVEISNITPPIEDDEDMIPF